MPGAACADTPQQGVAASIIAEFAARMFDARQRLPRHEVAGALAALQRALGAALAAAAENAAGERHGRREAASRRHARPPRAPGFERCPATPSIARARVIGPRPPPFPRA
jgi:hypothetical protein